MFIYLICTIVSNALKFLFSNTALFKFGCYKELKNKAKSAIKEKATLKNVITSVFNIAILCYIKDKLSIILNINSVYQLLLFVFGLAVVSTLNKKILIYLYNYIADQVKSRSKSKLDQLKNRFK